MATAVSRVEAMLVQMQYLHEPRAKKQPLKPKRRVPEDKYEENLAATLEEAYETKCYITGKTKSSLWRKASGL